MPAYDARVTSQHSACSIRLPSYASPTVAETGNSAQCQKTSSASIARRPSKLPIRLCRPSSVSSPPAARHARNPWFNLLGKRLLPIAPQPALIRVSADTIAAFSSPNYVTYHRSFSLALVAARKLTASLLRRSTDPRSTSPLKNSLRSRFYVPASPCSTVRRSGRSLVASRSA